MPEMIFCHAPTIHDIYPKLTRVADFEGFAAAVSKLRADSKETSGYFCGPLNGSGERKAEGATARNWLALDIDRIDPEVLDDVRVWFMPFQAMAWPTHSSTHEAPRMRVVAALSRDATRSECMAIGTVLTADLAKQFGNAVKLDQSTFRGEQPLFFLPQGAQLAQYTGAALDVDAYLARAPKTTAKEPPGGQRLGEKVAENRNDFLSRKGYSFARSGLQGEPLAQALLALNREWCDPPLDEAEVRGIAARKKIVPAEPQQPRPIFGGASQPLHGGEDPTGEILTNDKGVILACEHNAFTLVAGSEVYAELHYDEFLSRMRFGDRDWIDTDDLEVASWLQITHRVAKFTPNQARNAARLVAYSRRRDSLREFVEALPEWDGVERIAHAFTDAWGAPDSELMMAASSNFFIALVARAMQPGAQVDTLWTFEGPQGGYKSKSLRVLGEHFQAEISAPIGSTDFQREMRGVWIAELSELDSIRGKESSTIKRLLSAPADRFVQKYENHAQSYPRRAVSVATTNEANYWQDSTGARRLIPIPCGEIRIDLIAKTRMQWFAEARTKYDTDNSWWEFPNSIASAQDDRQLIDPWEDLIRSYIEHGKGPAMSWPSGPITTRAITMEWLELPVAQQGAACSTRIGKVMKRLGFTPVRIGGAQQRGWEKTPTKGQNGQVSG